jgi:diadenosine tetraphosphatase ApaH/serine/threonine PP2A family protein phosphatase
VRYAIIGDIHANHDALDVVLAHIRQSSIDETVCLGDIVGYGAEPVRCIETIRGLGCKVIAGNHDWAAIERITIDFFNAYAKAAALWTRNQLTAEHKEWLSNLPLTITFEPFAIAHGTFHQPESFNYIQTVFDAQLSFEVLKSLDRKLGFLGHSHVPVGFFDTEPITYTLDQSIPVQDRAVIVNAGSVGQPRDENSLACYAIYDTTDRKVTIIRLEYDIDAAAAKIREADLPEILAARLYHGK